MSINGISLQELNLDESEQLVGTAFCLELPGLQQTGEVFTSPHSSSTYFVRINNTLHKVKRIYSKGKLHGKGAHFVGQHLIEVWGNSQIKMRFEYQTTSVSEIGDGFHGVLTIAMNGRKAKFRIIGTNGC